MNIRIALPRRACNEHLQYRFFGDLTKMIFQLIYHFIRTLSLLKRIMESNREYHNKIMQHKTDFLNEAALVMNFPCNECESQYYGSNIREG